MVLHPDFEELELLRPRRLLTTQPARPVLTSFLSSRPQVYEKLLKTLRQLKSGMDKKSRNRKSSNGQVHTIPMTCLSFYFSDAPPTVDKWTSQYELLKSRTMVGSTDLQRTRRTWLCYWTQSVEICYNERCESCKMVFGN